jgi:hypothetical protein
MDPLIMEAIKLDLQLSNKNKEDGLKLNNSWKPLIVSQNKCHTSYDSSATTPSYTSFYHLFMFIPLPPLDHSPYPLLSLLIMHLLPSFQPPSFFEPMTTHSPLLVDFMSWCGPIISYPLTL